MGRIGGSWERPEPEMKLKVVLVGMSFVGKTSLLMRFERNVFEEKMVPTVGVSYHVKNLYIDGTTVRVHIWDTAGSELYGSIIRSYFRDVHCAIVVYDVAVRESFEDVDRWCYDVREISPNALMVLVGNKIDLAERAVPRVEAEEKAAQKGMMYHEASALSGEGVEDAFYASIRAMYTVAKTAVERPPLEHSVLGGDNEANRRRRCC